MSNAYTVVREFEKSIAEYTGAPYAVSVESCSAALFLCFQYRSLTQKGIEVEIPTNTYPSVPNGLVHAGFKIRFVDITWQRFGWYTIHPLKIIDSAKCLSRGMWGKLSMKMQTFMNRQSKLICLSFHGKKCLKIGRGGMILTDNEEGVEWFKRARFDGRNECPLPNDTLAFPGWNLYLSPEQAARGLELMQWIKNKNIDEPDEYQDLSQYKFYTEANR